MEELCVVFLRDAMKEFIFKIDDKIKFDNENPLSVDNYEQYDMKDFLVKFLNAEDFNFLSQSLLSKFDDFKSIKQIQKDMRVAVNFIFEYQPNRKSYYNNFMDCFANNYSLVKYTDNLQSFWGSKKIKFANNNCVDPAYDIYVVTSLHSLFYIFLKKFIDYGGRPVRACQKCGTYFLTEKRTDELFCNNIFENTGKTCKQLASEFKKAEKLKNDDLYKLYHVLRSKMKKRVTRHPNIQGEYDTWVEKAKDMYSKYNDKEISDEEFKNWIDENNKK